MAPEEIEKRHDKTKNWVELVPPAQRVLHDISLSADSAKEKFRMRDSASIYYAKWVYARPRAVAIAQDGYCQFFRTKGIFGERLSQTSTDVNYGYMVLPNMELKESEPTYHNMRSMSLMSKSSDFNKEYFTLNYLVKREDVIDYIEYIRPMTEQPADSKESLNAYLSRIKFDQRPIIANCHDNRLMGIPLSGGNFNGVNFRRAILLGCSLENTTWQGAHLDYAELGQFEAWVSLRNSNFSKCTAEKSVWKNIDFQGSKFKSAQMTGAHVESFIFTSNDFDQGAEWYFAEFYDARLSVHGIVSSELLPLERNEQIPLSPAISRPQLKDIFDTIRPRLTRVEVRTESIQSSVHQILNAIDLQTGLKITAIAVTSNSTYFSIGCDKGSVYCQEQKAGAVKYILKQGENPISSLSWCNQNRYLVSGSLDYFACIWDSQSFSGGNRAPICRLTGHSNWLTCVTWSLAFEYYVATSSYDGTVRIWNTADLSTITHQEILIGTIVLAVAWSPIGKKLAATGRNKIYLIDAPDDGIALNWSHVKTLSHYHYGMASYKVEMLAWSTSSYLASADKKGVFVWDDQGKYVTYFSSVGDKYLRWKDESELACAVSKDALKTKVIFWNKENRTNSNIYERARLSHDIKLYSSNALYFSEGATLFKWDLSASAQSDPERILIAGELSHRASDDHVTNPMH